MREHSRNPKDSPLLADQGVAGQTGVCPRAAEMKCRAPQSTQAPCASQRVGMSKGRSCYVARPHYRAVDFPEAVMRRTSILLLILTSLPRPHK